MNYSEFNSFYNLYDEDETVVERFESMLRHITWELFNRQEEWINPACQNGEKYPRLKENARDVMSMIYDEAHGFMKSCVLDALIDMYYREVINLPDNLKAHMEDEFGHHYDDWPENLAYTDWMDGHTPIDERYTRPLYEFENDN